MKDLGKFRKYLRQQSRTTVLLAVALVAMVAMLLYRLGSLTGHLSSGEFETSTAIYGWHGIYNQPLYLPLNLVRSALFLGFVHHGQSLTRLPNAFFGGLAIISFAWLIWLWHGSRTAIFATLLFATSAWTLHASRLASYDVLYLCAMPLLLLIHVGMQRQAERAVVFYGSLLAWGALLTVPGMVWLVGLSVFLQRKAILQGWRYFELWWHRVLSVLAVLIWLPLIAIDLTRPGNLRLWLGLPRHLAAPLTLLKQFGGVFVHLFIRGPQYPTIWLARAPILDIFTLVICLLGILFYVRHWRASRSRLLGSYALMGVILVALGGPVGLSLLVPLLYVAAAAGVAYLLQDWLKTFPLNPLARGLGIGLVSLAVLLSCVYNLRAYFVAWPHNDVTQATFRYRR